MEGSSKEGGADNVGYEETEIQVPAMADYLGVDSHAEANSHTYVYEPNRSLHQMTLEAFPNEDNYRNLSDVFNRPTIEQLLEGKKIDDTRPAAGSGDAEAGGEEAVDQGKVIKFGWVEGVLMRCLLNIWGTMLFLRLTWVVGQAGIWQGMAIISLANLVTVLSAISMSAIATNGQIAAGGVYFMISRALGPALGGSIGLMFTIANTISVSTYTIGFAESMLDFLQDLVPNWDGIVTPLSECMVAGCRPNDVRIIGGPVLCLFLVIAFAGMDWVTRIQKSLLILLILAQVDMLIGSFLDIAYGTAYVSSITPEDGYKNIDQAQRHAFGYTGWSMDTADKNWSPDYKESAIASDPAFMELFGVFFTAVTGIVAGANLSGDLKDPADAIPKGTLLAIALTYVTYMWFAMQTGFVFLREASGVREEYQYYEEYNQEWPTHLWGPEPNNYTLPRHTDCSINDTAIRRAIKLQDTDWYDSGGQWAATTESCIYGSGQDQMTMTYVSFTGYLRYAGGFSASLSSAIASLVGAPRVLQAVGVDKIYPGVFWFAKGGNANNDPWRGYFLVFFIAFGLCMIASLNEVSVIASNFFLAAYALMNLSCFHSSITKAPSWRPAFTWYNPWLSLASSVLCIILMFLMEWVYATVTIVVLIILGGYILYHNPEANWGSSTQGQVFVSAVKAAQTLTDTPEHVKNFRPKILVLTGNPAHRPPLVNFASLVTKSSSLLITGHVMDEGAPINVPALKDNVQLWMKDHSVKGFYSVLQAPTLADGARSMMSLSGLGKLSPNMLLLGFKKDWMRNRGELKQYVDILFAGFNHNMSIGILRVKSGFDYSKIIASEEVVEHKAKEAMPKGGLSLEPHGDGEGNLKSRKVSVFRGKDGNFISSKHVAGIQMFTNKTYTGFIDVWWLYDDGGLTLLLPYILTTRKQYANCKLRVFGLSNSNSQGLDEEQKNLAQLLAKFRITAADVVIIPDVTKKADPATRDEFAEMIEGQDIDQRELQEEKEKTNRHLRLAELLRQYSSESELIVITLPLVRRDRTSPAIYMAWLDIMTKDLPPCLIMRGNQQSVLTFYS